MYKTTAFTPAMIQRSRIFKTQRKTGDGGAIRLFDPVTARVSGWMRGPKEETVLTPAGVGKPDYNQLTVKELFTLAKVHHGLQVTTRMRKAELVSALQGA